MKAPIFLKPIFHEKIWGGTRLQDKYGYDIPSCRTGECWAISAHPNGANIVRNGPYEGLTLAELWQNHPELFGHFKSDRFPLLTKIIDANDDLSVQVHPDDEYARTNENGELGKTECWYIIDCEEGAEIIFGHHAQTKEEFASMVEEGRWNDLLQRVPIAPGDFFYVPSGTLHALCKGTFVLETQQSSDITYRVYDYDRRDQDGNKRELHLEKALAVTIVPHTHQKAEPAIMKTKQFAITTFVEERYFTVYKWDVHEELNMIQEKPFLLASVIDGQGVLHTEDSRNALQKGDHFILPYELGSFSIKGEIQLIVSHP